MNDMSLIPFMITTTWTTFYVLLMDPPSLLEGRPRMPHLGLSLGHNQGITSGAPYFLHVRVAQYDFLLRLWTSLVPGLGLDSHPHQAVWPQLRAGITLTTASGDRAYINKLLFNYNVTRGGSHISQQVCVCVSMQYRNVNHSLCA